MSLPSAAALAEEGRTEERRGGVAVLRRTSPQVAGMEQLRSRVLGRVCAGLWGLRRSLMVTSSARTGQNSVVIWAHSRPGGLQLSCGGRRWRRRLQMSLYSVRVLINCASSLIKAVYFEIPIIRIALCRGRSMPASGG